jgi:DUF4097 and DUF4098 domain-containing protein YvlB
MRILASALIALTVAAAPAAAGQKETETIDRTVSIGTNGTLKLRNFSGDVRITGTSGREVVVHAVRRAEREQLANIKLDIETSGSSVTIEANKRESRWTDRKNNVVETDFDIKVPFGTELDLYSFSGRLEVVGVKARIDAETFSGNVILEVPDGKVPALNVETFSGDIQARMPASADARVEFNSFSGDVDSDLPIAMRSTRRRNVSGEIGNGSGSTLKFKTFSGDLRIRRH